MSLHDILMSRAMIHFGNEIGGAFVNTPPNTMFSKIAERVVENIKSAQEDSQKQREEEAISERNMKNYKKFIGNGTLVPSLKIEDGKSKFVLSTPSAAEQKAGFEMGTEKDFIKDVQSGIDANTLRLRYPGKSSDIDKLQIAGTIKADSNTPINIGNVGSLSVSPNFEVDTGGEEKRKLVPTGFDALGRPTGWGINKPSASQEARNVETKELAGQVKNMADLFVRARKEASAIEGFGKSGWKGRLLNQEAIFRGKLGEFPKINVFQDRVKAFATFVAKAAGEVRPTDEDIDRFSKSLMNLSLNDEENALQIEQVIKDIENKGHSISWAYPMIDAYEKETGVKVNISRGTNDVKKKVKLTVGDFIIEEE